jgi:hypothetical protein
VKGSGHDLIWGIIPLSAWRDWGKQQKLSENSRVLDRYLTFNLPNTKQECKTLDCNVLWNIILKKEFLEELIACFPLIRRGQHRKRRQFLRTEGVAWSALIRFYRPEPLLFHSSGASFILTRLSGPCSRPTTSQKIWSRWESNPGPLDL